MPLLTRTRSSSDPVEQVVEQVRGRAREAREVGLEAAERAREASGPALERAREASGPALERAREVSEPALERAREASAPALSQLFVLLRRLLGTLVRVVSLLPGIASRGLGWLSGALGTLADSTAAVAEAERPSQLARRRRRRRAVLWFSGGFAVGAAAGYAACEMTAGEQPAPRGYDAQTGPTAVPDTAASPTGSANG